MGGSRYEIFFPLGQDPGLQVAGLTIGARVDVIDDELVKNFIVFAKGEDERRVDCVHTVAY